MYTSGINALTSVARYAAPVSNAIGRELTVAKVGTFVVGTLGILALDSIAKAQAGPMTYAVCVAGCTALNPNPFWAAICAAACVPGGLAPSP